MQSIPAHHPQTQSQTRLTSHLVVHGNPKKPGVSECLEKIIRWSSEGRHRISVADEIAGVNPELAAQANGRIEIFKPGDQGRGIMTPDMPTLLVILGGDGTLLHTIPQFWPLHAPVLGVNLGSLSFNAAVMPEKLEDALDDWLAGKLRLTERTVLKVACRRDGVVISESIAINDVVLTKKMEPRLINVEMSQGDELVSSFAGDGVIVATATGSTAYNLSAGGPILHPTLHAVVATAICAHTLAARPVVLPTSPPLQLKFLPHHGINEAMLAIDGQRHWTIGAGDCVELQACEAPLYLAASGDIKFYARLRQKLSWSRGAGGAPGDKCANATTD